MRKQPYLGIEVEGGEGSLPAVWAAFLARGAERAGEGSKSERVNRDSLPLVHGASLKVQPCIAPRIAVTTPNIQHKGNAWPRQE
jgi:hypothetical protein